MSSDSRVVGQALVLWGLVCLMVAGTVRAKDPPTVVYLHTEFLPYDAENEGDSFMRILREIPRQAFLMAARDEMGLITRDESLAEVPPEDENVIHLALLERKAYKKPWVLRLYKVDSDGGPVPIEDLWETEPLWSKQYEAELDTPKVYHTESKAFYDLVASDMVAALEAAGCERLATESAEAEGDAADFDIAEVEKRLLKVDVITQFGMVRAIHEQIAKEGESPELLSLLVRGYAHLSLHTLHHWNASTDVFAARAALYARRLLDKSSESDLAQWNTAYMWAILGLPNHASEVLDDLKQRDSYDPDTLPAWTKLIEPIIEFDRDSLKQLAEEDESEIAPWAARMFYQVSFFYRYPEWMYEAGMLVARIAPQSYDVYDNMAQRGVRLGVIRQGAAMSPMAMARFAPESLDAVPGMPDTIRALLPTDPIKAALAKTLYSDPEPNDAFSPVPTLIADRLRDYSKQETSRAISFSALGYLLREEVLVQAANVLDVSRAGTEVSAQPIIDGVLPFLKDHRYAAFIKAYDLNRFRSSKEYRELTKDLRIVDTCNSMNLLTFNMGGVEDDEGNEIGSTAWRRMRRDYNTYTAVDALFTFSTSINIRDGRESNALKWLWLDRPALNDSDIVRRAEMQLRARLPDLPTAEEVKKWEEETKFDPLCFSLLASFYSKLGDSEAAIRCYEKSLESMPTIDATFGLARLHEAAGDYDKWEEVQLDFLDSPDLGLEHARIHSNLAWGLMRRGLWKKAKPHAVESAQTWSAWGMRDASIACEGLADWEESEFWIREASANYPTTSGANWYLWCKRTGRGDLQSAKPLAEHRYGNPNYDSNRNSEIDRAAYQLLEGDYEKALKHYQKALSFQPTYSCTAMVAMLARDLGQDDLAETTIKAYQEFLDQLGEDADLTKRTTGKMLDILRTKSTTEEQLQELDLDLQEVDSQNRCVLAYVLARQLEDIGKETEAMEYYRKALVIAAHDPNYATLAGARLAERLTTSRKGDDVLDESDLWPQPKDEANDEDEDDSQ